MRRLASVLALFASLGLAVSLHAQAQSAPLPGPQYDTVIAAPEAHIGKTVWWIVRFSSVVIDVGPDGAVTRSQTMFEYRDVGGSWTGRHVLAPRPEDFKWPEPAYVNRNPQTQPRFLTGTIAAVEQATDANGLRLLIPVLSHITLEALPVEAVVVPSQTNGVSWPMILREEKPRYTPEAIDAKIQGAVELSAIVLADGTVGDVRVTKSLDTTFGLDDAAIQAVKKWLFKPGLKDGVPLATRVHLVLEFRLSK